MLKKIWQVVAKIQQGEHFGPVVDRITAESTERFLRDKGYAVRIELAQPNKHGIIESVKGDCDG